MPDDVSAAATNQNETPSSDAAQSAANYITAALAAAQLYVGGAISRAGTGADARSNQDAIEAARAVYAPMMGRDRGRQASSSVALAAWQAALPFREQYRDADRAAGRAETRLRTLHPDAMERYEALRAGLDPVQAMREVAPLIGREIANPQARAEFAPMLGDSQGRDATSQQALQAWKAAVPLREHIPEADVAASRAEDRLRELHPEAMAQYDALRAEHSPVEAARQAALLLDPPGQASAPDPGTVPAQRDGSRAAAPAGEQTGPPSDPGRNDQGPVSVPPSERFAAAVKTALPAELAAVVLADKAWPKLAAALDSAEQRGANPGDLLATVAGKREIESAKSPALVLKHRVEREHPIQDESADQPPVQESEAGTAETGEAAQAAVDSTSVDPVNDGADVLQPPTTAAAAPAAAAQNFATPITDATVAAPVPDVAAAAAGQVLAREADVLADSARDGASTPDDHSTPSLDEHREGVLEAATLDNRTAATDAQAGALQSQSGAPTAGKASSETASSAPQSGTSPAAIAAQNFATPLNQASTSGPSAPASQNTAPPPTATQNTARQR